MGGPPGEVSEDAAVEGITTTAGIGTIPLGQRPTQCYSSPRMRLLGCRALWVPGSLPLRMAMQICNHWASARPPRPRPPRHPQRPQRPQRPPRPQRRPRPLALPPQRPHLPPPRRAQPRLEVAEVGEAAGAAAAAVVGRGFGGLQRHLE